MLRFYYSKNSSSLAAHILLFEVGAAFETVEVSIAEGAHLSEAFLAVNPKGRVPALGTTDGIITENPAILEYIAANHPEAGLLPVSPFAQAKARELCAYLCATAHVNFAHGFRGSRWADDEASFADMKQRVPRNMQDCAAYLETNIGPWALGDTYSYCDPYLNQFHRWMDKAEIGYKGFPKLQAHAEAMRTRPAVQRAYELYELT